MQSRMIYRLIIIGLLLPCVQYAWAGNANDTSNTVVVEQAVEVLQLYQKVALGNDYQMEITVLKSSDGRSASGAGQIYVPFLGEMLQVEFEDIAVNQLGQLRDGAIWVAGADIAQPNHSTPENNVLDYLKLAKENDQLPFLLSPRLIAEGMDFRGHDLVMTKLVFTQFGASFDALFMVHNPDGSVHPFSQQDIAIVDGVLDFCDLRLPIVGNDVKYSDPTFPFVIRGFRPGETGADEGTFAAFSCEGLDSFQLVGAFVFDPTRVSLQLPELGEIGEEDGVATDSPAIPPTELIATFRTKVVNWGQFYAEVNFNGPFKVDGVDDTIFEIGDGIIDYNDDEGKNPPGKDGTWRGFYLETFSVQLPKSFAFDNEHSENAATGKKRIKVSADDLYYEPGRGLSVDVNVTGTPVGTPILPVASMEGWQIWVNRVSLKITNNELVGGLVVAGKIHIPVTDQGDEVNYEATFNGSASSLRVILENDQIFGIPFLGEESKLTLFSSSSVLLNREGISANLSGEMDVKVDDFAFEGLGFEGLNIPTTGIQDISVYAFSFGDYEFIVDEFPGLQGPPPSELEDEAATNDAEGEGEQIKGFPISISNISFGDGGFLERLTAPSGNVAATYSNDITTTAVNEDVAIKLKKIGFTVKVNFTDEKVGLNAEGDVEVFGQIIASALIPTADIANYKPWEAFDYHDFKVNRLMVDMDMGGLRLAGGVQFFEDTPGMKRYGTGFKGAFTLGLEPNITVEAIAQFGTAPEGFRYWFADALFRYKPGVQMGPSPLGLYGFGGGAYYNMTPVVNNISMSLDEPTTALAPGDINLTPGVALSGTIYNPTQVNENDLLGVKATVVLGTFPKSETANMDLTLGMEFVMAPTFGLHTVRLTGDAYFMAPIDERENAKVTAKATIVYNHTEKLLDANLKTFIKLPMLRGDGMTSLHVNLNEDQSNDWYIAIGAPPLTSRIKTDFKVAGLTAVFNCYFVAGNINALKPAELRQLPLLREYHEELAVFQGEVENMDLTQLTDGFSILMGAQLSLGPIDERWWIFRAKADATIGFDLLMSQKECINEQGESYEIGIDGWYLEGQAYAALSGGVDVYVDILVYDDWYNIFTINAGALMQVALPDPNWMKANIAGSYSILDGLIQGDFDAEFEVGEKCETQQTPLDPSELIAHIQIISEVKPAGSQPIAVVPANREIIAVATCAIPINSILDFSENSSDGLQLRPVMKNISISNSPKGEWRYLNAAGYSVGPDGQYEVIEFVSSALLETKNYKINVTTNWEQRTNADLNWRPVKKDGVGIPSEVDQGTFVGGPKPDYLTDEDLLAAWPNTKTLNHPIEENPEGTGLALKMDGWGHLFNPVREVNGKEYQYDFYLRIRDMSIQTGGTNEDGDPLGEIIFQEPLQAIPEQPAWGEEVAQIIEFVVTDCGGTGVIQIITKILGTKCYLPKTGSNIKQPGKNEAWTSSNNNNTDPNNKISNVGLAQYSWDFGGGNHNDLAVRRGLVESQNIGFPDFSHVLQPSQVYEIEIVGIPQLEEEYQVVASTNEAAGTNVTDEITASGQAYTITQVSAAVVGQFEGVPEKPIYSYRFATSQYSDFITKLQNSTLGAISFRNDDDDNWTYNDFGQFYSNINYIVYNSTLVDDNADYGITTIENPEGFDLYEDRRLIINSTPDVHFDWKWYGNPKKRYNEYTSYYTAFNEDPVGIRGDRQLTDLNGLTSKPTNNNLSYFTFFHRWADLQTKMDDLMNKVYDRLYYGQRSLNIKFRDGLYFKEYDYAEVYYIGISTTPSRFAFIKNHSDGTYLIQSPSGRYLGPSLNIATTNFPMYHFTLTQEQANTPLYSFSLGGQVTYPNMIIEPYDQPFVRPYNRDDYFDLKYEMPGFGSVNLSWNGPGNTEVGTLTGDYSGRYYIRNAASGRYVFGDISDEGTTIYSFFSNENDNDDYSISRSNLGGENGGPFLLDKQDDGSVFIIVGEQYLYEDPFTKVVSWTATNNSAYNRFYLDQSRVAIPEDLNGTYRIQCAASGRYLYKGDDIMLSFTAENKGALSSYTIFRQSGDYFHIKTDGKYIRAVENANQWSYQLSTNTADGDEFLFDLEKKGSSYHIKNKASGEYLYEKFDLNFGPEHHALLSSVAPIDGNYAKFNLVSTTYTDPQDLSDEYYIRVKGSGNYIYGDGEKIASKLEVSNSFVLKRLDGEYKYEIWDTSTGNRLFKDGNEVATISSIGEDYEHKLLGVDDYFRIQINDKFFYETYDLTAGNKIYCSSWGAWNELDDAQFYLERAGNFVVQQAGQQNAALDFDGVDDFVNCGNSIDLSNKSFTVEFWAKRNAVSANNFIVFQGDNSLNRGLHIGFRSNNKFTFAFYGNDLNVNDSYSDQSWHHWACVYDQNNNTRTIYRDGVKVEEDYPDVSYSGTGDLFVGKLLTGGYFNGQLDEVRIWNTSRTSAQIQAQMNQELTGVQEGLTAYYNFNEGTPCGDNNSITELTDLTGFNNNGTLNGFSSSNGCTSNFVPYTPTAYNDPSSLIFDGDGNEYTSVEIGAQTWLAQNLRTMKYHDGTAISQGASWYNSDQQYEDPYGILYSWNALNQQGKNPCPLGWHIPSDTEWTILIDFYEARDDYNNLISGGSSGFEAQLGGLRTDGQFENLELQGLYWTSTQKSLEGPSAWIYKFNAYSNNIYRRFILKSEWSSCRCIKD